MSKPTLEQEGTARTAAAPPEADPFISVIVPVRNEERYLRGTLEQLLGQSYDPDRFQVIVADGRSTDGTRAVVREMQQRHPRLLLLDNPRGWSSAGRNAAITAACGDLIVLVDGHCQVDSPFYLREIASAFARSGAACVGRPQPLDVSGATPLQLAVALARASRLGHHPASHIYSDGEGLVPPQSVAVAYRREVFEEVGLFDEAFDACEDVELNHRLARAGVQCFLTPRVKVRYHPRGTLPGLFRQMLRYGRGRARLLRKHPDTFSAGSLLPALFLAGLLAGPLLAWLLPLLWLVYLPAVGLYAALVLGFSVALAARGRRLHLLPWLPPVFLAIHLGAGAGLLRELMGGASLPPLEVDMKQPARS